MKRTDKEQIVADLAQKLKGASALYYTDFTGLNVKRMTELRRRLKKAGVEYVVIKNTLALKAVNEGGFDGVRLHGPTGLVVAQDAIIAAKLLTDFAKENDQRPAVKGGIYEGAAIDAALVKKLATMPTRDEALSQFVGALNSVLMMFALALEGRKTQLEEAAPAPVAAAPTESAPVAEAAAPESAPDAPSDESPQASA
jgi:large subunit ribosomal protein L10